ncbi:hypothetical protein BOTBODRAFT_645521 [Botryobasidium botryosum FD-172 SS1]|uniref:DUF6532 domain-containing protein n=1 Tax=Botryobasidium botryosum (strain FD-172 SS1) TaxID=930990 RepID=A0A067MAD0_BOTB1|nr:hypothetical protein BOTBODRAFT_645521 [Botryobasidium botryosum FD-172 SS1]
MKNSARLRSPLTKAIDPAEASSLARHPTRTTTAMTLIPKFCFTTTILVTKKRTIMRVTLTAAGLMINADITETTIGPTTAGRVIWIVKLLAIGSDRTASSDSHRSVLHPHHDQLSRKRKAADDSSSDSESDGKRAKRNSSQPSKSRPKVSDYPRDVQAILYRAISIHRSRIASEAPFPDADLEGQIAEEAFQLACRAKKKHYTSNADLIKVVSPLVASHSLSHTFDSGLTPINICKSTSQMRGELKVIARYMVELFFGFHDRSSKIRANKRRYRELTTDSAFLYEDPSKLEAMWCSPILFKLVKRMFFKKKNDDSIQSSEYFNPIKPPTIALAYATVRCALDEWSEGIFDPVDFTTAAYKDVYDELRQGLAELAEDLEGERELTNLGQELWEESR